ncbi:MAG: class I tRNA ligase family protein [Ilumatobacteraceae bacterium]
MFYDGPPFANGLPHYGHLLTGYVKDAVPRYQTMRGRKVERRFGWDCHGLPAEVQVEKELGISGHPEILKYGVGAFNDACRTSVLQFTDEWRDYVTRQARWVDFDHDYKTLDTDYMESVMWALKTLWDKGLMYEGFRVLWYCWHCETPLSNTETKMDDTYRPRQDPAVTVSLRADAPGTDLDGVNMLVWTTTPWTLPSNLAAAVHPDVEYVVVESGEHPGERFPRRGTRRRVCASWVRNRRWCRCAGADLIGTRYHPPFDFFVGRARPSGTGGRLRHHRRRHRRRPHRPGLR